MDLIEVLGLEHGAHAHRPPDEEQIQQADLCSI